jgi:signal transduction histidine kinase
MEMSEALGREIFLIEAWHFLALLVILGVNSWFFRNGKKSRLLYRYLLLQAVPLLWVISKILKTIAPTVTLRWVFIVTQYLAVCALGPLFFYFAWHYVFNRDLKLKFRIILGTPSLIFFLIAATNPLHHLFYATYTFYRDTFGPVFYLLSGYTYLLTLAGIVLFLLGMFRLRRTELRGEFLLVAAAVIPLIINAVYTYRLFGFRQKFDYTPLFMTLSLAFFGIAAFRSRFLGVLPSAWKRLLLELEDPLILTDRKNRVCRVTKIDPHTPPEPEIHQKGKIFRLHRISESRKGTLYHYVDVSRVEELKTEVEEKNRQLELSIRELQEYNRKTLEMMETVLLNRSRREMHDILGHSLTQVIYLLRLEKETPSLPSAKASRIAAARDLINRGLSRLEESLADKVAEGNSLSIALGNLIQESRLPGVTLDFILRGNQRPLPEPLVRELTGCCREAITNALKHGRPERIDLVVLYGDKQVALLISDNGSGCSLCRPGHGLGLMEEGIARFSGTLTFWSAPEEGFQMTIKVPYPAA